MKYFCSFIMVIALAATPGTATLAGGGLVLEEDACILRIDFYSAHFTAYQPDTSGNEQFCENLPDIGATIFVLDYLHQSLKEVPVDFRIIQDVTGLGRFVKLKHVEALDDIDQHTVFYQAPVIQADASFKIEYEFLHEGNYIGIVTAGHPTSEQIYTAIFPFEVGGSNTFYLIPVTLFIAILVSFLWLKWRRRTHADALSKKMPNEEPKQ